MSAGYGFFNVAFFKKDGTPDCGTAQKALAWADGNFGWVKELHPFALDGGNCWTNNDGKWTNGVDIKRTGVPDGLGWIKELGDAVGAEKILADEFQDFSESDSSACSTVTATYCCGSFGTGIFKVEDGVLTECLAAEGDVAIPREVTEIGEDALNGFRSLTGVTIPDGVTEIGSGAFCDCASLKSIVIPGSVEKLGSNAFEDCYRLSSVELRGGLKEIGVGAFDGCSSLESVSIPEGVTKIGGSAFLCCTSLESVTIPGSVTEIGGSAFEGCDSLAEIRFGGTKEQWKAVKKGDYWNEDVPATDVLVRKQ